MGKPGKLKSGTRTKLKRWSKGNSSSSNPSLFTHREKARSSFFSKNSSKGLTVKALKFHEQVKNCKNTSQNNLNATIDIEVNSDSAETFGTFLSGVSDCTNVTFRKIQRYWNSNASQHKEVCAVLAAITEVLREQKSDESDTAYFAALVTALSNVEKLESAAAISYLLSLSIKKVPVAVLQAKFGEISKIFCNLLGQVALKKGNAPTAFLRSLITCLATLLQHQELILWENSSTLNVYHAILQLINHAKPKIRKASQEAICTILYKSDFVKNNTSSNFYHPAAVATVNACVLQLEKVGGLGSNHTVCHILDLLGRLFPCIPQSSVKTACENILRLMILSDFVVKTACLKSLEGIFKSTRCCIALTPELTAQIITALYDYYPNASDVQGAIAWLDIMNKAVLTLCTQFAGTPSDKEAVHLALVHVPKLLITCIKLLLSQSDIVQKSSATTAENLLKDGIGRFWNNDKVAIDNDDKQKFVVTVIKALEEGLKYKYHLVWNLIFNIIEICFHCFLNFSYMSNAATIIKSIVDLRNTTNFQFRTELDSCIGSAIATLGPKLFLDVVPLEIDGMKINEDFSRSWLIPLLKKHMKNAELKFFSEYFLPLTSNFQTATNERKNINKQIEAATYQALYMQCWDLLPVFCKEAIDIAASFPKIARVMGRALEEIEELQQLIMSALRNLITTAKKNTKDKAVVGGYCKNFLPILFNIYTNVKSDKSEETDDKSDKVDSFDGNKIKSLERLASLETIKMFLTLTSSELIHTYFTKIKSKVFEKPDLNNASRLALLDLLIVMVSYSSSNQIEEIFPLVKDMLKKHNHSMQKKGYRILQEICSSHSQPCVDFVNTNLKKLENLLIKNLSQASLSSKGPRIKCIEHVYLLLHSNAATQKQSNRFLNNILPEVILCTSEAKRSRVAAFDLLINAAKAYIGYENQENILDTTTKLEEYFDIVCIGLGGSTTMMKATIAALSRLVYEFKDIISSTLLNTTIENMCILLSSNTREITKAAFGFVFVLLHILDTQQFAQHLQSILGALLNWKDHTRRYFRLLIKKLLVRVVRKYGYETIHSMIPEEHKKQLISVRKQLSRAKRLEAEKVHANDADHNILKKKETMEEILASSENESDDEQPRNKNKLKVKHSTMLQELEDDPVDFLDPSASQKIISNNPKMPQKAKKQAFLTAPDGRLIIYDGKLDDVEDDDKKILKSLGIDKHKSSSNEAISKGRKRKLIGSDEDDDDGVDIPIKSKKMVYKPGGKGIHRALKLEDCGIQFKAKKAGGDVKRKGSKDPYAYLPFNRELLNKRKRKKMSGQYNNFVKSARKGATSGLKKKNKNHFRKK